MTAPSTLVDTTRHSAILPTELLRKHSVTIVGVGAIGSKAAEVVVKMGFPVLRLYDHDTVETHNVSCQGFGVRDVGQLKANLIAERLRADTGANIIGYPVKVAEQMEFLTSIVISAVDTMDGRALMFDSFMSSPSARFYLDGRMAAMFGQVYIVDKSDADTVAAYRASLYPQSEVAELPCTEKSTIFCAFGMASLMGAAITALVRGAKIDAHHVDIDFTNFHMMRVRKQS